MHSDLWKKIEQFNLDAPVSEYSFSVRLAHENNWTQNFTAKAMLEYKKFMYLAATSGLMVAPSGVIDIIWHQHLLFSQSYKDFCSLLGKVINHVPSTRNRLEAARFREARERTQKLYAKIFGAAPVEIWEYDSMYSQLDLPKSKLKWSHVELITAMAALVLLVPLYMVLKPLYLAIHGMLFIAYFIAAAGISFGVLYFSNNYCFKQLITGWYNKVFLLDLTAAELFYFKDKNITAALHAYVNGLLLDNKIDINDKDTVRAQNNAIANNPAEFSVLDTVRAEKKISYTDLIKKLQHKPAFKNIIENDAAIEKYMRHSVLFIRQYAFNTGLLAFTGLLGLERLIMGLSNGKPVGFLFMLLLVYCVFAYWLVNNFYQGFRLKLVEYYNEFVVPQHAHAEEVHWQYYALGATALSASLLPAIENAEAAFRREKAANNKGGDCSNCGSSCGGGCGGGCGGCGGD